MLESTDYLHSYVEQSAEIYVAHKFHWFQIV